jgi:hypothetical protein
MRYLWKQASFLWLQFFAVRRKDCAITEKLKPGLPAAHARSDVRSLLTWRGGLENVLAVSNRPIMTLCIVQKMYCA